MANFVSLDRRANTPKEVTIADGGTLSDVLTLDGFAIGMVYLPATFDGISLQFHVSPTYDGTFVSYEDTAGNAVALVVEASKAYALPEGLFGAPFCKLLAGAQTGDTVITVTLKG